MQQPKRDESHTRHSAKYFSDFYSEYVFYFQISAHTIKCHIRVPKCMMNPVNQGQPNISTLLILNEECNSHITAEL